MTVDLGYSAQPGRPCQWPLDWLACTNTTAIDSLTIREREIVETLAVDYLSNWTQGKYGLCPVAWRPCRQSCSGGPGSMYMPLAMSGGSYNVGCGVCGDVCGCNETPTLRLAGPVAAVDSVVIDGVTLAPSNYRLDNGNLLTRVDGSRWPTCQDMKTLVTDVGSFVINYQRGTPVPAGGQVAAGLLAAEMAKALCNDGDCQLPARVQQVTRQGVTVSLINDFNNLMANGQTGLWLVDAWLASVMQPRRQSRVYSPDIPRERYVDHVV